MRNERLNRVVVAGFVIGMVLGLAVAATPVATQALFAGKEPRAAAGDVLAVALTQAKDGSWERLGVARAHYLGGDEPRGQKIIDEVLAGEPEASDYRRIMRIYGEAKQWDKALAMADKLVAASPKDADDLVEAGAWYNLAGRRETAEVLFTRAVTIDPKEVWVTAAIGGSYLGVTPLPQ